MSTQSPSLAKQVAAGAAFMVVGRLAIRLISVVSTLILARLLVPEDFGVVALAAAVFSVAEVLTALGLGQLLVKRQTVDRDAYDTAFTMNLIRCLLLAVFVAATAPLQAEMFGEPRIEGVLWVVAATVALDGIISIGMVRLQRELRFKLVFRQQVAFKLLAFLFTLVFALTIGNYWCLVLGNLCAKLITIPYSYVLAPHRPRLCLVHWREFFHFSKWMFGYNIVSNFDWQVPNFSLAGMAGVTALGQFNVAYQIAAVPVTELAAPVRQPLYAGYAKVQHDAALLRSHYLQSFSLVAALTIPMAVGIALVAPEAERLALGPNFAGTWPLIAICALYVLADSFAHFTFGIFALKDRLREMVLTYAALVLLRAPLVIAGIWLDGVRGLLVALLASGLVNMVVWNRQAARAVGAGLADIMVELKRPVAAALVMMLAVLGLRWVLPADTAGILDDIWRLGLLASCGAVVHLTTQAVAWHLAGRPPGPERRAFDLVQAALQRRRRAWAG